MPTEPGAGDLPVRLNERVDVRAATAADFEAMAAVLEEAFEGWPDYEIPVSSLEHLRWKLGGPWADEHPSYLGELDGRIVGIITWLPRRVLIRGEECRLIDGGDRAVLPDQQGAGTGRSIQSAGDSDLANFHVRMSLRGRQRDRRWRERMRRQGSQPVAHELQNLMLPLDVGRLSADRASAGGRLPTPLLAVVLSGLTHGARLANRVRHLTPRRAATRTTNSRLTLRAVDAFDERVEPLVAAATMQFDFLIARSPAYLNWRFADPPAGRFEIRVVEDGDALVGYAVHKLGRGRAFLVDLLAMPGRLDVVETLVENAVAEARAANAAGVFAWLPKHHPYAATFRRAGFLNSRRRLAVQYTEGRLATPGQLDLLRDPRARIHYTMGDRDVI